MDMFNLAKEAIGVASSYVGFGRKRASLRRKLETLTSRESDVLKEVEYAESRLGNKRKREVENWLRNVQIVKGEISGIEPQVVERRVFPNISLVNKVNELTLEVEKLTDQGDFSGGLTHVEEDTRAYELLTVELVGEAFEQNQNKVLSRLMEDEVSTVGIYGMGGVGKTTLVTHIHNHLLKASTWRKVCWVTVSQEYDVFTLQQRISKCFDYVLREEDKIKRAAELSHLVKRESTVIILDDVWHTVDLQEVGVPLGVNGCKLILTTRSLEICEQMGCDELIKLEPLPENEAWQLFVENLGRGVVFAPEVESVAKSVAKECAGLPLGIVVVSGSMRGKQEDICEWRSTLEELKEARFEGTGMEDKVFRILKFSFIRLNDPVVQRCFLHLALYPEDFSIPTADLLQNLVYLDFFCELKSQQAQYDRGHTVVNKLINVCLLERSRVADSGSLKMHDLVRDMAIKMMGSTCMVKSGLSLCELPAEEEWVENLEKVSLMNNSISEIPPVRWDLPRLLELYLSENYLTRIDDSFFGCMPTLQVLDLSMTGIVMLPASISNMVNLTHLLLRGCEELEHIPSLAKLRALRTLDLCGAGIQEAPAGLCELVKLRCLDFCESGLKELPLGILPKLSNIQTLCLDSQCDSLTVKAQEIMSLSKLEKLKCKFVDVQSYDLYVKYLETGGPKEWQLELIEGARNDVNSFEYVSDCSRAVGLCGCSVGGYRPESSLLLPKDVQYLEITNADLEINSLTDIPSIKNSKLTRCQLSKIRGMKHLVSPSSSSPLPSLEFLELDSVMDLHALAEEELCAVATAVPGVLHEGNKFWGLKVLTIFACEKMKRLLTHVSLPLLANLEILSITRCDQMEEVIAMKEEVDMECKDEIGNSGSCRRSEADLSHLASALSLPKIKSLELRHLPALKSICRATITCNSLQSIYLSGCPKLEQISLLVQLPRDGENPSDCLQAIEIPHGDKEWWESVVWNDPLFKSSLDPYVTHENW